MDKVIKEIEEEYNILRAEIYPPSGSMEALRGVMIDKFFNERVPYLLSRIKELEESNEGLRNALDLRKGALVQATNGIKQLNQQIEKLEKGIWEIIKAHDEYALFLVDEIDELAGWAITHGWKSTRYEEGKKRREIITSLKEKLNKLIEKKWG